MLNAGSPLPGVSFIAAAPEVNDALPRMDIPAFVGFATAGPVNTPVPVEDVARFREIFREDLRLAWDNERKEPQYSYLGQAVDAFFRNGGVRCWAVRVAAKNIQRAYFKLPHLIPFSSDNPRLDAQGQFEDVLISARSPGIWGEHMQVSTRLSRDSLMTANLEASNGRGSRTCPIELEFDPRSNAQVVHIHLTAAPIGLQREDLLSVTFSEQGRRLYVFVDSIQQGNRGMTVSGRATFWFRRESPLSPPIAPMVAQGNTGEYPVPMQRSEGNAWLESWCDMNQPPSGIYVDRLRFEVLVWRKGKLDQRFGDLAFSRRHPRCWANLPSDDDLFRLSQGRKSRRFEPEIEHLRQQANSPRFDLAGPQTNHPSPYYLPMGMPQTVAKSFDSANNAETIHSGNAREGDGTDHFSADLFIDEDLKHVGTAILRQEAEHKYYTRPDPQPLQGIHSLLPVEEITMIAVPDAIHRSWSLDAVPIPAPLAAPVLEPVSGPDPFNRYTLKWSTVPKATRYLVQRSASPDFAEVSDYDIERPDVGKQREILPPETETTLSLPFECTCAQYFRVRSERYGQVSAWSNTRGAMLPPLDFSHCDTPSPGSLELNLALTRTGSPQDGWRVHWEMMSDDSTTADGYEMQWAYDSGFLSAQSLPLFLKGVNQFTPPDQPDGVTYYRIRARTSKTSGPWSNTVRIAPTNYNTHTLQPIKAYDDHQLQIIHRALIQFCAARRDLLAVLSLPRHYRHQDVLNHVQSFRALGSNSAEATPHTSETELSYAALYHPWLASNSEARRESDTPTDPIRITPPEGAVVGQMAKLAVTNGAWLAPANQPLEGILALEPEFNREQWGRLTTAGVNLIRHDPRGFIVLNADTLSRQNEFRLVNVRRLLILLLRLALREGTKHVFESNDAEFRYTVQHYFEQILSDLYVRGALAGRTPDEAFRVVADHSVNTALDSDRGRFVVELQVAPSEPISFIHVRLIQTGSGQLDVQEF